MKPVLPSILVVDDEVHALELFSRSLRKHAKVTTAASGDEAWEIFGAEEFLIVISDQRMPGMSGVDLLSRIADCRADVGRILLTGYSDLDATISAINRGHVHAYLHKPCSPPDLLAAIKTVSDRVELARENARLRRTIGETTSGGPRFDVNVRVAERLGRAVAELQRGDGTELAVDRLRVLAGELLDSASEFAPNSAALVGSLDEAIGAVLREVCVTAGAIGVEIESDLAAGEAPGVDTGAVLLALNQLVESALLAMPDGGLLRVSTGREQKDLVLRVSDTGDVPAASLAQASRSGPTNDRVGRVTDLGLAIVQRVAHAHGGSFAVEKCQDQGTEVTLRLALEGVGAAADE